VVVVAGIVFLSSIDGIVKQAVEEFGPRITKAEVKLETVEISMTSGSGRLAGLKVGNPQGFKTESAFRLGEIAVKLNLDATTGKMIVIKDILISAPQVTYELGASGSNLDALLKNVAAFTGGAKGAPAKTGGAKEDGPKLVIDNLRVMGGKVNVSATFLGGKSMSAGLPDLHLKDIGKEKKGATPGEVAQELITAIKDGAAKAVAPLGLDKMGDKLKEGLGAASKSLGGATSGVGEALDKGTKDAGQAIKNLFGK
jgi:hypothetical protein